MFDPSNSVAMPKFYSDGTVVVENDLSSEDWPHSSMSVIHSDIHYAENRRASEACPAILLRSDQKIDRETLPSTLANTVKLGGSCYSKEFQNVS